MSKILEENKDKIKNFYSGKELFKNIFKHENLILKAILSEDNLPFLFNGDENCNFIFLKDDDLKSWLVEIYEKIFVDFLLSNEPVFIKSIKINYYKKILSLLLKEYWKDSTYELLMSLQELSKKTPIIEKSDLDDILSSLNENNNITRKRKIYYLTR